MPREFMARQRPSSPPQKPSLCKGRWHAKRDGRVVLVTPEVRHIEFGKAKYIECKAHIEFALGKHITMPAGHAIYGVRLDIS